MFYEKHKDAKYPDAETRGGFIAKVVDRMKAFDDEFIEYVANAAREYAKLCVEAEYEQNRPGAIV